VTTIAGIAAGSGDSSAVLFQGGLLFRFAMHTDSCPIPRDPAAIPAIPRDLHCDLLDLAPARAS